MAFYAAVYYLVRALFSTPRQARLFHRRVSVCVEIACWIRNAWRRFVGQGRNFAAIQRLLEHYHQRYFLIPLQVAGDSQMGEPARGWNSARLIAETLSSFAKSRSEEHTSELQSLMRNSYAVFCLKKNNLSNNTPKDT